MKLNTKLFLGILFSSTALVNILLVYYIINLHNIMAPLYLHMIFILANLASVGILLLFGVLISLPSEPSEYIKFIRSWLKKKPPTTSPTSPVTEIASSPFLRPLTDRFSDSVKDDMVRAGVYKSPRYFVSMYVVVGMVLTVLIIPLSIYLAIVINPLLLSLSVIPAVVLISPKLDLILKREERKDAIKDELPFLTAYAMIYQSVGKTMVDALVKASGTDVFKQASKEGDIIGRYLRVGEDYVTALSQVSKTHPNEKFRTLLLGYTSVLESGGDLLTYLETKLKDFIEDMKFRWEKYVEDATNMSEMMLMLLFIFPTILLTSAFILPGESIATVNLFTVFGIPLLFTLIFMMVSANQPKTGDRIQGSILTPLISSIAGSMILYLIKMDVFIVVSSGITIYAGVNGVYVYRQLREISAVDNDLPRFLRDITEYRKMGYDLINGIIRISSEASYSNVFKRHLNYIATQLRLGRDMRLIVREIKMRSMLEAIILELLSTGIEEGEIKPTQLEMLIDFVSTVNRVKRETKSKLRLNTIISILAPIGLITTVYLVSSVATYFTGSTQLFGSIGQTTSSYMGQTGYSFATKGEILSLINSGKILLIVSSLGIGLLNGKIASFTVKDTLKLAIIMGITVLSLLFGDVLTSMFIKIIAGGAV